MYPFQDMCFWSFPNNFQLLFFLFLEQIFLCSAKKWSLLGTCKFFNRYEGALDPWMSALWSMLYQQNHRLLPKGPDFVTPDAPLLDQPKIQIIYHDAEEEPPLATTTGYFLKYYYFHNTFQGCTLVFQNSTIVETCYLVILFLVC